MAEKRELKSSYIAQSLDIKEFTTWDWPLSDFSDLIASRGKIFSPRHAVADELHLQNDHLPNAELVKKNIELLRLPSTFSITTGHQVCLVGGPMFTLYKIATTIALAKKLKSQYPDHDFVPVLWMATEDHDWEEVNHFFAQFDQKITYTGKFKGPVGRHILDESIVALFPTTISEKIRHCYRPGNTMAEAFRELMHSLFGHHGLVIIDADRASMKSLFVSKMAIELAANGMAAPVRATSASLENLGYKPQIFPRDINLFYLGVGGRSLIERDAEEVYHLKEGDRSWTKDEILKELEDHPENFSPNVALRPVYQEALLPNLAYIGGWGEVSYWLQLKAGFEHMGVPYPLVVPRLHATIFTATQGEAIASLGLPLYAITKPIHLLQDSYLKLNWDDSPFETKITDVEQAFDALAGHVSEIDPTLAAVVRAEQARSNNAFDGMRKKLKKAIRNRNPKPYQQLTDLKNAIEPENMEQQRILNFTAWNAIEYVNLVDLLIRAAENANAAPQWILLP